MRFKFITVSFLIALALNSQAETNNAFSAQKGVLNIGYSNALQNKVIKLQGDCEFYWNQLLEPKDFNDLTKIPKPEYVKIPKSWTTYKISGKKLPNTGYATYRVIIQKTADKEKKIYGLKVSTIFSSYKLWINGKFVAEIGKVGTSKNLSSPAFRYEDIPFILDPAEGSTEKIEVVFQVSNYSHQRSGLHFPIFISEYKNLVNETRWMDILNLIIVGIILVIGINHLSLYLFRKEDKSNLYFGIVCLVMILRNITTGDRMITYIFPNLNWELLIKLDNISGFGTIPLFALFIYSLFKEDFSNKVKNIIVTIGIFITALVLFTPAIIYGKLRTIYELYILIGGLYLTFGILLISTLRKRPYAIHSFVGMFILYSTAINDVLSSMGIIQTAYVAPFGLVAFMLIQSITINKKSAKAINSNEVLSIQLQHEKENLEIKIDERTRELQSQHDELLVHQKKEMQQNWINVGVASINEVLSKNKDDYKQLCNNVLSSLIKYIDAKAGALYVANTENKSDSYLEMVASFGLSKKDKMKNAIVATNSGLLGASYTENEVQHVTNLPEEYLSINSGLGSSQPKSLLIVPLTFDENVFGVIELASFKEINEVEIEFIKRIANSIANNLNTVKMHERNVKLIQQFKENSAHMKENEDRMRQNLEELEFIREQYESLKNSRVTEN